MIWETLERVVEYQAMDELGMGREVRTGRLADYRVNIASLPCILFGGY
jgi:hypothetical protein